MTLHIPIPDALARALAAVQSAGGVPLLVGGCVRDAVCDDLAGRAGATQPKDIDVEVGGIPAADLLALLERIGPVTMAGESFGVLKMRLGGMDVDWSLPRREQKAGRGHRGFLIESDPTLSPRAAAARRDYTMNAMMYAPQTGTLLDFFGGVDDLRAGVLRFAVSAARLAEDPLRMPRGANFCARFMLTPTPDTVVAWQLMRREAHTLARERMAEEWRKWARTSQQPSRALHWYRASGWLDLYPELVALIGVPQDPRHHPEGDVWTHTGHVLDALARTLRDARPDDQQVLAATFAALCHDLGKPATTVVASNGAITALNHAAHGVVPTHGVLDRMGMPAVLIARAAVLVQEHMVLASIGEHISPRAVRRLAVRLAAHGETINTLALVIAADVAGRPPLPPDPPRSLQQLLECAAATGVQHGQSPPILTGRMLRARGYAQGVALGLVLRAARTAQVDGAFDTLDGALAWLDAQPGLAVERAVVRDLQIPTHEWDAIAQAEQITYQGDLIRRDEWMLEVTQRGTDRVAVRAIGRSFGSALAVLCDNDDHACDDPAGTDTTIADLHP